MKHDVSQFKPAAAASPAALPAGERVIWQGRPSVKRLAIDAFHIRLVAIYFAALFAWRLASPMAGGASLADASISASWVIIPALASFGVLSLLAWLFARAATYTVTSKRVLLQFGVALPMTMTIPLQQIAGAALKLNRDGSGDIPLALVDDRASFLLLWPHVRPWKLRRAEPMLRAVPDAALVAAKLNEALSNLPAPAATARAASLSSRAASVSADAVAAA
jgi:hypothetical protein